MEVERLSPAQRATLAAGAMLLVTLVATGVMFYRRSKGEAPPAALRAFRAPHCCALCLSQPLLPRSCGHGIGLRRSAAQPSPSACHFPMQPMTPQSMSLPPPRALCWRRRWDRATLAACTARAARPRGRCAGLGAAGAGGHRQGQPGPSKRSSCMAHRGRACAQGAPRLRIHPTSLHCPGGS